MKIISLNTWGGRAGREKLLNFLREQSRDTDVFCLQEVWSAPYEHLEGSLAGGKELKHEQILVYGKQEISEVLNEFEYFFHPHFSNNYGLMMLVRKGLQVNGSGDFFVHKHEGYIPDGDIGGHARNIQYVSLFDERKRTFVINFHGLWNGKGKGDSEDRIEQSRNIVRFVQDLRGRVILCGDFNLLPATESLQILEDAGLRNLITEYRVTSTRTSYYTKPEKFADYALVSSEVEVKRFEVLGDEVSDHAPLLLEVT